MGTFSFSVLFKPLQSERAIFSVIQSHITSQQPLPHSGALTFPYVQIFNPIFVPSTTGIPACSVPSCPDPSSLKLTQNSAFPTTGLTANPPSSSSPHSTHPFPHHGLQLLHAVLLTSGNLVAPPSQSASRIAKKLVRRSAARALNASQS